MRKLLLLTITAFFLFSFFTTNGQTTNINGAPGVIATNPAVTINQSAAQPDPTNVVPINFMVVFDQPVSGFTTGDVVLSGTAGAIIAVVTGGPTTYNVAVTGMTNCGTVIANIPAGVCTNALSEPNLASTSIDNTVTLTTFPSTVNPVPDQQLCAGSVTNPVNFTSTPPGASFAWTNSTPSIGLPASGTGNIASFTALNPSATAVTATITVTPSAGACIGMPISFTITVNPLPVVIVTPNPTCGGPCNSMTASGSGADVYAWTPIAGLYTNCPPTQPYIGTNVSTVYTAPTNANLYQVTGTNLVTGCTRSAFGMPNYTPPAPVVVPSAVFMCLGDAPVKLKVVAAANTVQFCSGAINIPVPDNNPAGASNSIFVSGIPPGCNLTNITVTINMPHTRIGNMVFALRAPNGMILNLDYHLSTTGGSAATSGFVNTVISSIGTVALSAGASPYTGTFKADAQGIPAGGFGATGPTGMLATTQIWGPLVPTATSANGSWTLGFYDGVTGDVGTLTSWCLGITYSCGPIVPATPAVWSPAQGLFLDPAAAIPYIAGTATDSVWTKPTPAGVYPYQVTTQGQPAPLCTPTTNFVNINGNATVTFNLKNNHAFPIKISQIDSRTLTAGFTAVRAFYKPAAISGNPGVISSSNGWNQFGSAGITGTGTGVQPFMSNLQLVIPAGTTYGICLEAITTANAPNLAYSALSAGTYSFNDGGCELITGSNIGYSGLAVPAVPAVTPSGFIGAVHFAQTTVTCTSPPTTVVVTVGSSTTITAHPANQTICTDKIASFTVVAAGTGPFTYQWQVSTDGAGTWNNITDGGVYSGATTNTLTVTAPPVSMSGYYYKAIVNGTAACGTVSSGFAKLTVNPLPVVVISANPLIIGPAQTTTIHSVVTPNPAATYTWYYNGAVLAGATADTLLVDINGLGDYQLKVTDVNGCTSLSNIISISHSFALTLFTYPNPSGGIFQVRYYSEANNPVQRSLMVYDNRGEKIITRTFMQTIPYQKIDVDIRAHGKGLYWIELRDASGKRLAINRAVVQ